ncbi:DUF3667 domain-containing protein [Lewinella cohaerens]|uniref:DUF3667 domain-containing protein n=1 Tax=Lewinella cohaerens TaxID=70995 RepID=UPI0003624EBB|nr:DUF3667 domain-containing protein [Lewinella cohaerens]
MPGSLPKNFPDPQIKRISTKTIGASLLSILNLERGIFYTVWELIKNPGAAMRRYLFTNRSGFIEPMKFLVVTIPIYLFISFTFFPDSGFFAGFENGLAGNQDDAIDPEKQALTKNLISIFKEYANLLLLITVPLAAIFTKILFRKYRLNFGEHLVINAFLYGFLTFASTLLLPTAWISTDVNSWLMALLYLVYTTYFFQSLFQFSWWRSFGNTILIYLFSLLITVVVFIGFMIVGLLVLL